jgi:tetratricopeptide (TPR) repeat protein
VIQTASTRHETDRSSVWPSLIILSLFTLLTFANSWPDALVFDDALFLGPEPQHRLDSLHDAFKKPLWNTDNSLYRPLLSIDFELQSRLFGSWLQGYHLLNILVHLVTTLSLFGFLSYLVRTTQPNVKNSRFYVLLAVLIFAVHPTHAEVVNSVFNKSSMYVSLAAITGLWWLHSNLDRKPLRAWIGFGLIYSVAILFKESALVLPGIAVAMIVLFTKGSLLVRIRRFLPVFWLFIPIAAYFLARAMALGPAGIDTTAGPDELTSILGDNQLVVTHAPVLGIAQFGMGLKILLWPYPARLFHDTGGQLEIAAYIGLQVVFWIWAIYLLVKGRPVLAFALVFYYLALLPSIRLIHIEGEWPHIAERFLYFPSVGLTFGLVAGLQALSKRLRLDHLQFIMLPVILALAAISWDRNQDWGSATQLFETEYQIGKRGLDSLRIVISAHYNFGRYERVAKICDENQHYLKDSYKFLFVCSDVYLRQGRIIDATDALENYARDGRQWIKARLALVAIYLATRQYQRVVGQYAAIIDRVEEPAAKDLYKGEMLLAVYPDDVEQLSLARSLFQQAMTRDPNLAVAAERIKLVDERLAEIDAQTPLSDDGQE